jgi:hypothetical protein
MKSPNLVGERTRLLVTVHAPAASPHGPRRSSVSLTFVLFRRLWTRPLIIHADKIQTGPAHALRVRDVRRILAAVPPAWIEGLQEVRLTNSLEHTAWAFFSTYYASLIIYAAAALLNRLSWPSCRSLLPARSASPRATATGFRQPRHIASMQSLPRSLRSSFPRSRLQRHGQVIILPFHFVLYHSTNE